MTTDQISKLLLTDKDDPGYTYDPARDDKSVKDTPEVLTAGGSDCQTFVDAEEALSTKYGTVAQVDRALSKVAEGHGIHSSVAVLPTEEKGLTMLADLAAGLKGCKSLTLTQSDGPVTMAPSAIPAMMREGEVGFISYVTINGNTILMAFELDHVGKAVSEVVLIGPTTNDEKKLEQMGSTLGRLSDIQVERLKAAQGIN
ncbi:sensor domain-containing protein [Catenulispora subtropica]|uniref:PknH-like extracellular domain-containing protein n=1 Tax=Catenulispora subtropica TaxID=450798 RepID=A0ABP5DXB9_9ACTN